MDEKLIEHYDLEVFTPPCEPGAERYTAVARLSAASQKALADCPPLFAPQYAQRLAALQAMVIEAPAVGSPPKGEPR